MPFAALHESVRGTNAKCLDVRYTAAIGGKADTGRTLALLISGRGIAQVISNGGQVIPLTNDAELDYQPAWRPS